MASLLELMVFQPSALVDAQLAANCCVLLLFVGSLSELAIASCCFVLVHDVSVGNKHLLFTFASCCFVAILVDS